MDIKLPSEVNLKSVLQIRKYVYLPIAVVVVIVLLFAFVVTPRVQLILKLRRDLDRTNKELLSLEEKVSTLEGFDESVLLEQLKLLEKVLPSHKAIVEWILTLSGLSEETGIVIGQLAFKPGSIATESATSSSIPRVGESESGAGEISSARDRSQNRASKVDYFGLNLAIDASFDSFVDFLSRFDDMSPIVRLTELELSSSTNVNSSLSLVAPEQNLSANISIFLFYAENPKSLGAVTAQVIPITELDMELYNELAQFREYKPSTTSAVFVGREDVFAPF